MTHPFPHVRGPLVWAALGTLLAIGAGCAEPGQPPAGAPDAALPAPDAAPHDAAGPADAAEWDVAADAAVPTDVPGDDGTGSDGAVQDDLGAIPDVAADAAPLDAEPPDAGPPDVGPADIGSPDAAPETTAPDATEDAGPAPVATSTVTTLVSPGELLPTCETASGDLYYGAPPAGASGFTQSGGLSFGRVMRWDRVAGQASQLLETGCTVGDPWVFVDHATPSHAVLQLACVPSGAGVPDPLYGYAIHDRATGTVSGVVIDGSPGKIGAYPRTVGDHVCALTGAGVGPHTLRCVAATPPFAPTADVADVRDFVAGGTQVALRGSSGALSVRASPTAAPVATAVLPDGDPLFRAVAWSAARDAFLVFEATGSGKGRIWEVDGQGQTTLRVGPFTVATPGLLSLRLRLSGDGRYLLFGDVGAGGTILRALDLVGGAAQVVAEATADYRGLWVDGDPATPLVVVAAPDAGGTQAVHLWNLDTGASHPLTDHPAQGLPGATFARLRAGRVYFVEQPVPAVARFVRLDPGSGRVTLLEQPIGPNGLPAWDVTDGGEKLYLVEPGEALSGTLRELALLPSPASATAHVLGDVVTIERCGACPIAVVEVGTDLAEYAAICP